MMAKTKQWASETDFSKGNFYTLEYDSSSSNPIRADWTNNKILYRLNGGFANKNSEGNINMPRLRMQHADAFDETHYVFSIGAKDGQIRGQIRVIEGPQTKFPDINIAKNLEEYVQGVSIGLAGMRSIMHREGDKFSTEQKLDILYQASRASSAVTVLSLMMQKGIKKNRETVVNTEIAPELLKVYRLV